jgi:hypothetical protein
MLRRKQRFADHASAHASAEIAVFAEFDFSGDFYLLDTHALPEITLPLYLRPLTSFFAQAMVLSSIKLSTHFRGFNVVSRRANLPRSPATLPFILPLYVAACLTLAAPVRAQQPAATSSPLTLLDGPAPRDFGAFLGGGTGAGKSSNTQFCLPVVAPAASLRLIWLATHFCGEL